MRGSEGREMEFMQQLDLIPPAPEQPGWPEAATALPGLTYQPGYLSAKDQQGLLRHIDDDAAPWRHDIERRVQHYGWRYDYRSRQVTANMRLGSFPGWLQRLADRLYEDKFFDPAPDQAIVNEYQPGQGIAMHIDRQCFGPVVATISLGDAWQMDLRPVRGQEGETQHVLLEPGSLLVMSGPARWRWMHGIAARRREREIGGWRPRLRRVSVTFRTVLSEVSRA